MYIRYAECYLLYYYLRIKTCFHQISEQKDSILWAPNSKLISYFRPYIQAWYHLQRLIEFLDVRISLESSTYKFRDISQSDLFTLK